MARKSASMLRRAGSGRLSYAATASWCALTHLGTKGRRSCRREVEMIVSRSTSKGMPRLFLGLARQLAYRLKRLMAERQSVNHRNEHQCRMPQWLDKETRSSRADAQPLSSLRGHNTWYTVGSSDWNRNRRQYDQYLTVPVICASVTLLLSSCNIYLLNCAHKLYPRRRYQCHQTMAENLELRDCKRWIPITLVVGPQVIPI